jgi:hypothetical protein
MTVMLPDSPNIPDDDFAAPFETIQAPVGEKAQDRSSDQDPPPEYAIESAEPAPKGPPKTVVDMAEGTGKNLKKAGDAVGNAAKKTWTCLSSFFSDC